MQLTACKTSDEPEPAFLRSRYKQGFLVAEQASSKFNEWLGQNMKQLQSQEYLQGAEGLKKHILYFIHLLHLGAFC